MSSSENQVDLQASIIPVTPLQQNCTLLFDKISKKAVIVDPGGDVPVLLKAIDELSAEVDTDLVDLMVISIMRAELRNSRKDLADRFPS